MKFSTIELLHKEPAPEHAPEKCIKTEGRQEQYPEKLSIYKLFWIFVIASVLGYILETIWCYLTLGRIESRQGLVYGPFSQIYGLGAVLFTVCMNRLERKPFFVVFVLCATLGGAFEYVCSLAEQNLLGAVSWNYKLPLSIGGRTNVLFCFFWGIGGVVLVRYIYPPFSRAIDRLPLRPGYTVTWVAAVLIIADCVISSAALERQTQRLQGMPATNEVSVLLDQYYPDSFLQKVYPNLIHTAAASASSTSATGGNK